MNGTEVVQWDLAFPESATKSWLLHSRFFPSKMGGYPAWLALNDLPDTSCPRCTQKMTFLCQVYSPWEDAGSDSGFHRAVFVFFCRAASCHKEAGAGQGGGAFKVFRSQLGRKNDFYPFHPPKEEVMGADDLKFVVPDLCRLCGSPGDKMCGGCKRVKYCSKEHQERDWKRPSGHKTECKNMDLDLSVKPQRNGFNLPELELVIEPAEDEDLPEEANEESDGDDEDVDKEEMEKYEALQKEGKTGTLSAKEIAKHLAEDEDKKADPVFVHFKRSIQHSPEQVIRYGKGGQPLWISSKDIPKKIPCCEICGAKRQFEFQMMPQRLNGCDLDASTLSEESVDWGVIAVFTCSNSCDPSGSTAYKSEFVHVQSVPHE